MRKTILKLLIVVSLIGFLEIRPTNSYFATKDDVLNNHVSTGCWTEPEFPQFEPLFETANFEDVPFAWPAATTTCPTSVLNYRLQIFRDESLTDLFVESAWAPDSGYVYDNLLEGHYWWRVLAIDQYSLQTESQKFHLLVDRTLPTVSLSIEGSYSKLVEEKITNNWLTAGDVELIGGVYQIGKPTYTSDLGKYIWENRLMQSFPAGAKTLALDYDFLSNDFGANDNPGFLIRLNGQDIFHLDDTAANLGPQKFYYDLSSYNSGQLNLAIYSGNTIDRSYQSWAYVTNISTYFVSAPAHATYTLTPTDTNLASDACRYKTELDSDWQTGNTFHISSEGTHTLSYFCFDAAQNVSNEHVVTVITDATAPEAVTDLSGLETASTVSLSWTAPADAAKYDVRYAACPGFNFDTATAVDKVPAPGAGGMPESLEVLGLNPDTEYCFALKAADQAPNWSALSNLFGIKTAVGPTLVNSGDVVINELMWTGSSLSENDEWLELRNMTDRTIDLTGFRFLKYDDSDMGVDFTGKSIAPHAYFVISNFAASSSRLKDSLLIDLVDPGLTINNSTLKVKLVDSDDNVIDEAWDGTAPKEGGEFYSMERTEVPGNGANPLSWYSCLDSASTTEFFDAGAGERGTPGAANRSANEPVPQPSLTTSIKDNKFFFNINNALYESLTYELTYEHDGIAEGIKGISLPSEGIVLGTCSSGGACVYHASAKNFVLKVTLGSGERTYGLEATN